MVESAETESVGPRALGRSVARREDLGLLTGRARFGDDLPVRADTAHAVFARAPHAHADIDAIDCSAARACPGVIAVITGDDIAPLSKPFVVGVKQPMHHWCLAMDRVRYVGEPVAIVLAENRYAAEDAAEELRVTYTPRSVVIDPEAAAADDAPLLHDDVSTNVVSDRRFVHGDPDQAFTDADHQIAITVRYPRNSCTPIEGFFVNAEYDVVNDGYDVVSNFQGPFALHPVMAMALKVPSNKLRLRTPPASGGSFGVKQGVFPYIVAAALAARIIRRPVKWVEDRLEHLMAANTATNRVTTLAAAVTADGTITALNYDQLDDCGAYLRAPEPASLYRMHGNLSGAYAVRHIRVRNRVVLTNKTPSGLNRGFGGPQLYFALERLVQKIAATLGLDPLTVVRRNLVPTDRFPYQTPSGARLDSGDFLNTVAQGERDGDLAALLQKRDVARAAGRLYGIGYAAIVEPSVSNMGYITTVLTAEERRRAGPKNGAYACATIAVDPLGGLAVTTASTPQGQGHATVCAQIVADTFGLAPEQVTVNLEFDTTKDAWSIAAGNYSSRFAPAVAGTVHLAAIRLRDKISRIAAASLNIDASAVRYADGKVYAAGNPSNAVPFHRVAGTSHWAPGTLPEENVPALRETAFWSPPELTAPTADDEINSSAAYGFIFDFCGVEIDRDTGRVHVDRYVTTHDAGRLLHPAMADGQIRGGFAQAVGAALYEEFRYLPDGSFQSGTFADYAVPTVHEIPRPEIIHTETPSPVTPLGAKGIGEGNSMSTPVCLANAVADALSVEDIVLPLTPQRVIALLNDTEPAAPQSLTTTAPDTSDPSATAGGLRGNGTIDVASEPNSLWQRMLSPDALRAAIPGCRHLERLSETHYQGEAALGLGPVRGRFSGDIRLTDLDSPRALTLSGDISGALGSAHGVARIRLTPIPTGTRVAYEYETNIGGRIAAVGGRMLQNAADHLVAATFARLTATDEQQKRLSRSWWSRIRKWLGLET